VGKKTRDSERFKIGRLVQEPDPHQRDTLPLCPVCGGKGFVLKSEVIEVAGNYRTGDVKHECKWCGGDGVVSAEVATMFRRWTKILLHNRRLGLCSKD